MAVADFIRTAISASPRLRRVVKSRHAQRLIQSGRASRTVASTSRFLAHELVASGVRTHQIRGTGLQVRVRHGTRDVDILTETFSRRCYEPPEAAARALTRRRLHVLDLGGNIGTFALYAFAHWPIQSLTSYEPDPENAAVLFDTIRENPHLPWRLKEAAVSNRNGTLRFISGRFSEARAADEHESGIEVTLLDVFDIAGEADVIKIDIEGSEWPILGDPRLAGLTAGVIVIECHARGCPGTTPAGAARDRLEAAGYQVIVRAGANPAGSALLWAVR